MRCYQTRGSSGSRLSNRSLGFRWKARQCPLSVWVSPAGHHFQIHLGRKTVDKFKPLFAVQSNTALRVRPHQAKFPCEGTSCTSRRASTGDLPDGGRAWRPAEPLGGPVFQGFGLTLHSQGVEGLPLTGFPAQTSKTNEISLSLSRSRHRVPLSFACARGEEPLSLSRGPSLLDPGPPFPLSLSLYLPPLHTTKRNV